MTNTYFNYTNPVMPGSTILTSKYNGDFRAVERAFDTLPSPNELVGSYKNVGVTAGTASAFTLSIPSFDPSFGYAVGMQVIAKMHVSNNGPSTLSVNGLPAKPVVNLISGLGPLVNGDLRVGAMYELRYDGSRFQVMNATSNVVAQTLTNANAAAVSAAAATTAFNNSIKVNSVKFFDPSVDPNVAYPGTTWVMLPGTSTAAKGWRRTA